MRKPLVLLPSLRKQTLLTLVPRRWTLIAFFCFVFVIRLSLHLSLPFVLDILLLLWFASTFPFEWLISRSDTPYKLTVIQFSYFFMELLLLTLLIHFSGLTHWFGAMFYVYTIIYSNILMSKNLSRAIIISAIVLYSSLVIAEGAGILRHYLPLGLPSSDLSDPSLTWILSTILILMAITTFGSMGFTIKGLTEHLRKREEDIHFLSMKYKDAQSTKENLRKELMTTRMKVSTDGLTGLYNQVYFKHRLAVEFSLANLNDTPLSVVFIDLDDFKKYNDTYGHQAGDAALATYARLIKDGARSTDVVARYGGEEFTILLPKTGLEEVLKIVERIRTSVRAEKSFKRSLTFSAGVSTHPFHGHSDEELLRIADIALYHAKEHGKNQTVVAEITTSNAENTEQS